MEVGGEGGLREIYRGWSFLLLPAGSLPSSDPPTKRMLSWYPPSAHPWGSCPIRNCVDPGLGLPV